MKTKNCTKCGNVFHTADQSDGVRMCLACKAKYNQQHPDGLPAKGKDMLKSKDGYQNNIMICQECGHEHDLGNFQLVSKTPTQPEPERKIPVCKKCGYVEFSDGCSCDNQPETDKPVADLLLPAIRQYCHNDGFGLVAGYDRKETEKIVAGLVAKIKSLTQPEPGCGQEFEKLVNKILLEGRSGGWLKNSPLDIRIKKLKDVLAGRASRL